ncbi:hypothetical protein KCU71_g9576, partial [Aureobasidium melanogenum]
MKTMSESDNKERVEQATRSLKKIQQASNIQWLKKQRRTCKGIKPFILDISGYSYNLASINELLSVDLVQHDKGTCPPAPADHISVFLERLHEAINEDYDHDAPYFQAVDLPEDYVLQLKQTDGLRDTDLRSSGVCGVNGIQNANIVKVTDQSRYNMSRDRPNTDNLPGGSAPEIYGWNINADF